MQVLEYRRFGGCSCRLSPPDLVCLTHSDPGHTGTSMPDTGARGATLVGRLPPEAEAHLFHRLVNWSLAGDLERAGPGMPQHCPAAGMLQEEAGAQIPVFHQGRYDRNRRWTETRTRVKLRQTQTFPCCRRREVTWGRSANNQTKGSFGRTVTLPPASEGQNLTA